MTREQSAAKESYRKAKEAYEASPSPVAKEALEAAAETCRSLGLNAPKVG